MYTNTHVFVAEPSTDEMKDTTTDTAAEMASAPAQSSGFGVITPVVKVQYVCSTLPGPPARASHCCRNMGACVFQPITAAVT